MTGDRNETARAISQLAGWAVQTPLSAIPREVLARGVRVLADDLSAIVGARDEPEVAAFHGRVIGRARVAESTVFRGGRQRTDRLSAAVANAMAADWLELDEGYRVTPCHAGLYVLPALLAEAEATNLPFEALLRALVLGYEIVTRVARAWTPRAMNMQSHGRYSAVGAAAGVALARRAEAHLLVAALGTAVTLTGPSPRNHLAEGILARNVWPASGAWSGSMAVEWAECGIAGAPGAFHDVYSTVLGGEAHPQKLVEGLGERWAIEDGYTKIYACCQHLHSAVEATVAMRDRLLARASVDDIASVRVETHDLALPLVNYRPETTLGAKFSMPHAIAAAIVTGTGGAAAFAAATLAEPAIGRLRERVTMAPWAPLLPPPNDRPARVTVELRDGGRLEAECLSAAGGPDRPLPPGTVLEKMSVLAAPVYPRMRPLFEQLLQLEPARMRAGWADLVGELCG
jgi:2-methylcitrate dehydratase PrpD